MLTQEDIVEALRACFDPASGRDLIALGLVHSLQLEPDAAAPGYGIPGVPTPQRLALVLQLSGDEDRQALIAGQVRNRLGGVQGLSRIDLRWERELFPILNRRAG